MAAYNAGNYIAEAILSVINQTWQNWELIIINDCSTDNTASEIARFKDERIKVFHNEQNEGIVYTRNRALHYSQGKYVAVLDADDVFLPEKLAVQVDFLERNQDYAMVGTGFGYINEKSIPIEGSSKLLAKAEHFPAILLFNNYFVHSSVMYKTNLGKQILYKPLVKGFSPSEEYQLFVQFAKTHKVCNLSEKLTLYRQHQSGISKKREDKINEYIDRIIVSQLKPLKINPTTEELKLHKSIRFAYDNLEWIHIGEIKNWIMKLIRQNKSCEIYDGYFDEYLALKWYEIAKFNANYGLQMLITFHSCSLSLHPVIDWEKRKFLMERCLYEFKVKLF